MFDYGRAERSDRGPDTLAAISLADLLLQPPEFGGPAVSDRHVSGDLTDQIAAGQYTVREVREHVQFIACDLTILQDTSVESIMPASLWIGLISEGMWRGRIDGRDLELGPIGQPVLIGLTEDTDCIDHQLSGNHTRMASFFVNARFFESEEGATDGSGSLDHVRRMMDGSATTFASIPSSSLARTLGTLANCPYTGALADLYFESAALASIVEVGRLTEHAAPDIDRPTSRALAVANAARQHIDDDLATFCGVSVLARRLGTNETTLRRQFKSVFGCTIIEYVMQQRLQAAKLLIRESDLQIAQIAYRIGYVDPGNFSTAYKRFFGRTPREDRAQRFKG